MNKKYLPAIIIIFIVLLSIVAVYFFNNSKDKPNGDNNITIYSENGINELPLPTEGNLTVIDTNVDTNIRVINEIDETFTSADKNLLIMFASWCPNCQAEISEIEKILKHYKDNKDVNVVLIAHEYEETVTDLIKLIENDVDFGNIEVNLDLKRIIRKTIDPDASTIPISYVIDKEANVLKVHNDSLTLEKAIEMVEK